MQRLILFSLESDKSFHTPTYKNLTNHSLQPNAKEVAAAEEAERKRLERERKKQVEEDQLRREQRGKDALRKEQLTRLLQHLMEGLDEAQRQQHISQFMSGKEGSVSKWKCKDFNCLTRTFNRLLKKNPSVSSIRPVK